MGPPPYQCQGATRKGERRSRESPHSQRADRLQALYPPWGQFFRTVTTLHTLHDYRHLVLCMLPA